jgi:phage regulator Rha-like protein
MTPDETLEINRSQIATGSQKHRDPRFPPFVFTEHGALMAANLLNSQKAIEVSVYVVRAFVRLRETFAQHRDLAVQLQELEKKMEEQALKHDTLAAITRQQMKQVFEAIRELMSPAEPIKRRTIGFVTDEQASTPKRGRGSATRRAARV